MQIVITFTGNNKTMDLLVDNRQQIADTLNILEETENFFPDDMQKIHYVKSIRKNRLISVFCNYEEAEIYSGDALEIYGSKL